MSKAGLFGLILILGAIIALIVHSRQKEKALEEETSGFVIETVSAVSKAWEPEALTKRAEPGLVKAMSSQGQSIGELFTVYSKLGAPVGDPDCALKDTSQFDGSKGSYVTASYTCEAQYEKGPATILITVRHLEPDGDWKVYYLNVSSPYFSEAGYQPTK